MIIIFFFNESNVFKYGRTDFRISFSMVLWFDLSFSVHVKNVIWPEWSAASVFVKQDDRYFLLPEHKHAMTTIGEDKFKLEQLEKDWRGIIFLNRIQSKMVNYYEHRKYVHKSNLDE